MFGEWTREVLEGIRVLTPVIPLSLSAQERLTALQVSTKCDGSPVSITDIAVQALVLHGLHQAFPEDRVLAEENPSLESPAFLEMVRALLPADVDPVAACRDSVHRLAPEFPRVWVLDPIDGTYGFIRSGNYAIGLALLVGGEVRVSFVGWPRHAPDFTGVPVAGPVIAVAAHGNGAAIADLEGNFFPIRPADPRNRLLYSGSKTPGDLEWQQWVAEKCGIAERVEMTSMAKGIAVGCGQAVLYLRTFGVVSRHHEFIWDIAPYELFVREAGGFVTDSEGRQLVYTEDGRVCPGPDLIIATNNGADFHQQIIAACSEYRSWYESR